MEPPRFFTRGLSFWRARPGGIIPAFQLHRLPFDELSRLGGVMENIDKSL